MQIAPQVRYAQKGKRHALTTKIYTTDVYASGVLCHSNGLETLSLSFSRCVLKLKLKLKSAFYRRMYLSLSLSRFLLS
jgi:hypothetical protein